MTRKGVCDLCIDNLLADPLFSDMSRAGAADMCQQLGGEIYKHPCEDPLWCDCGCNWLEPMQAIKRCLPRVPRTKCPMCRSLKVVLNLQSEIGRCLDCKASWGGANFWKPTIFLPMTPIEEVRPW